MNNRINQIKQLSKLIRLIMKLKKVHEKLYCSYSSWWTKNNGRIKKNLKICKKTKRRELKT